MGSSSSSLSLRILLVSAGVVSAAMAMKFSLPLMLDFAVLYVPAIWSFILSWLRPPYLYVVVNGIIITIVASSRFHHHLNHQHHENQSQPLIDPTNGLPPSDLPAELPPMSIQPSFGVSEQPPVIYEIERGPMEEPLVIYEIEHSAMDEPPVIYEPSFGISEQPPVIYGIEHEAIEEPLVIYEIEHSAVAEPSMVYESESEPPVVDVETVPVNGSEVVIVDKENESVISRSSWNPPERIINSPPPAKKIQSEFILPVREKPLVSSRFANQRKTSKTNPEGVRSLRVAKPRKHETLESTWKMITDGRHIPLTRHLRKTDTIDNNYHSDERHSDAYAGEQESAAEDNNAVTIAETFNDRTDFDHRNHRVPSFKKSTPSSGGKLRKEGSPSHDELNRRVEAFIKKFNDEMRLQRQESLNRYMEMINRGAQ